MYYTTTNEFKKPEFPKYLLTSLLKTLGKTEPDDEPISLEFILNNNGLYSAIWALRCLPNGKELAVKFAVWNAKQVLPISEAAHKVVSEVDNADEYNEDDDEDDDNHQPESAATRAARYAAAYAGRSTYSAARASVAADAYDEIINATSAAIDAVGYWAVHIAYDPTAPDAATHAARTASVDAFKEKQYEAFISLLNDELEA